MIETPFLRVMSVDMDISQAGLEWVLETWLSNYETAPSVLWCHPKQIARADRVLDMLAVKYRSIVAIPDVTYLEGWWSLGTRRDKGMGSVGA